MATALDLIRRAYRKLGVAAADEPLTADQTLEGLDALNAMMHGLALLGVDVAHVDLTIGDVFALPPEFHEGVVYMLAGRLASDYMTPPTFDADAWLRAMQAAYLTIPVAEIDLALRRTPSQRVKNAGT